MDRTVTLEEALQVHAALDSGGREHPPNADLRADTLAGLEIQLRQ